MGRFDFDCGWLWRWVLADALDAYPPYGNLEVYVGRISLRRIRHYHHRTLLPKINNGLGNLIGGFNGLGAGLEIPLGDDQVHQLAGQVHIGLLQGARVDDPQGC